jgi:hypothetical protein
MQTHGFAEMAERFKAMPDELMDKYIQKANYKACEIVRDDAKVRAPIHEGPYPASRTQTLGLLTPKMDLSRDVTSKAIENAQRERPGQHISGREIRALRTMVNKMFKTTGRQVWNSIRSPGTLRKSIIIRKGKNPNKDYIVRNVALTKFAYYGMWLEFGFMHAGKERKHIPSHPFMRPSLYENKEKVIDTMRLGLMDGLNKFDKAKGKAA